MSARPVVSAAREEVRSVVPRPIELTETLPLSAAQVVKQAFEEKKP